MDDDIDNMDFDLPPELVNNQGSSSSMFQPGAVLDVRSKEIFKRWVCLYPVYIDQSKSHGEGRLIPKQLSVKAPASIYMAEAVAQLGLKVALEPDRRHPRDAFTFGRVRVQLYQSSGSRRPINPEFPTKKALLVRIASMLPTLEKEMVQMDGKVAAFAAASRSEISKNIQELTLNASKVSKDASQPQTTAASSSKKSKKSKRK